jgi:hypothetical protein
VFDRDAARGFASTVHDVQTQFLNIDPFVDDISNAFCDCQPPLQRSQLWGTHHVAPNGCLCQKAFAIDHPSSAPCFVLQASCAALLLQGILQALAIHWHLYDRIGELVTWPSGMVFKLSMWTCSWSSLVAIRLERGREASRVARRILYG